MMTREELEAALEKVDRLTTGPDGPVIAAARKQLALMPEKCDEPGCKDGIWNIRESIRYGYPCPVCHGSKVYPPETVEKIARLFDGISVTPKIWAVAVLDALGETE